MSKHDRHTYTGDTRDSGNRGIEVTEHTVASAGHPDRNEDAALGDVARLKAEAERPPVLGDPKNELVRSHLEVIRESSDREMAAADALKERGIFGVFDGVSGKESGMGAGVVASRIASGTVAERLADLPVDAGVEQTKEAIRDAILAANTDVVDYKKNPAYAKALEQMGCTVDVIRPIEKPDGTIEVAYGHMGDSRIYVLDGETGELKQMTRDDSAVEFFVEQGQLTRREADLIIGAEKGKMDELFKALPDKDPEWLKKMVNFRQAIVKSIGQPGEPAVGSFTVKRGDKVLLSSDGIHDNVPAERIAEIMRAGGGAKELAEEAFRRAGGRGGEKDPKAKGPDDITAKVLEFGGESKERGKEAGKERKASPEQFDRAVAETRLKLDVLPSAAEVGQKEHDRQKYEVLKELSDYLHAQVGAADPGLGARAETMAAELAGNGPEKRALANLDIIALNNIRRSSGGEEMPMMDMRSMQWFAEFEKAGWSAEQVRQWIESRKYEMDMSAQAEMEADPALKRMVGAHAELARTDAELRRLSRDMTGRQVAEDQARLEQARVQVSRTPVMFMDAAEVRRARAKAEQEMRAKKEQEQKQAKKPWWKFWGKK